MHSLTGAPLGVGYLLQGFPGVAEFLDPREAPAGVEDYLNLIHAGAMLRARPGGCQPPRFTARPCSP